MAGDGACLFHSIAQVLVDTGRQKAATADLVRERIVTKLRQEADAVH